MRCLLYKLPGQSPVRGQGDERPFCSGWCWPWAVAGRRRAWAVTGRWRPAVVTASAAVQTGALEVSRATVSLFRSGSIPSRLHMAVHGRARTSRSSEVSGCVASCFGEKGITLNSTLGEEHLAPGLLLRGESGGEPIPSMARCTASARRKSLRFGPAAPEPEAV